MEGLNWYNIIGVSQFSSIRSLCLPLEKKMHLLNFYLLTKAFVKIIVMRITKRRKFGNIV